MFSRTARDIMETHFCVQIGAYSYGACFDVGAFPAGTQIGRYVSLAGGVMVFQRNHPMDRLSTHPFFYNKALGVVPADNIVSTKLRVEHDVWIGYRAMITPGCSRIGLGAVVGAGALVTKDIPDFAVVAGNPAKLIRWRFSEEIRRAVEDSRWWELDLGEARRHLTAFTTPLDMNALRQILRGHHNS